MKRDYVGEDGAMTPALSFFAIVPGPAELAVLPKAIRADTAGSVTLQAVGDTVPQTINMVAGETLPLRVRYVTAATATLHGLV